MATDKQIKRLMELKELLEAGVLTPEEVQKEKGAILLDGNKALRDNNPKQPNAAMNGKSFFVRNKKSLIGGLILLCIIAVGACGLTIARMEKSKRSLASFEEAEASWGGQKAKESNSGSTIEADKESIKALVEKWNTCHNNLDSNGLEALLGENVKYYQTAYSKEKVVSSKASLFAKVSDYKQDITDLTITELPNKSYKASFTKTVDADGKTGSYPSYLVMKEVDGRFIIVEESDLISNKNISNKRISDMELLAEDSQYAYYVKTITEGVDFDLSDVQLYRLDKKDFDLKLLLLIGNTCTAFPSLHPEDGDRKYEILDIVRILIISPSRIIISGCPSIHADVVSFLYDVDEEKGVEFTSYAGFPELQEEDGNWVISISGVSYDEDGKMFYRRVYDLNGYLIAES